MSPVAAPSPASSRAPQIRALLAIIGVTTVTVLPVFLVGGLAVQMRSDLEYSVVYHGVLVGAYFAATSISSVPAGTLAQRIGSRPAMRLATLVAAAALTVLTVAPSFWLLLLGLVVGGVSNAISQPTANALVVDAIRADPNGTAIGLKQAAVPLAGLLSGLAVPTIAVSFGWRWVFGVAAVVALASLRRVPSSSDHEKFVRTRTSAERDAVWPLVIVAVGMALAAAATNSMVVYTTQIGVAVGMSIASAGLLLAVGSLLAVATRVGVGWWSDRRGSGYFHFVAGMLAFGAVAMWAMGTQRGVVFVLGTIIAFITVWGWAGVFHLAVVSSYPSTPAVATGVVLAGGTVGGAIGPILIGTVLQQHGRTTALLLMATSALVAAGVFVLGSRTIEYERGNRGERQPQ